jgi:hypothetical protein
MEVDFDNFTPPVIDDNTWNEDELLLLDLLERDDNTWNEDELLLRDVNTSAAASVPGVTGTGDWDLFGTGDWDLFGNDENMSAASVPDLFGNDENMSAAASVTDDSDENMSNDDSDENMNAAASVNMNPSSATMRKFFKPAVTMNPYPSSSAASVPDWAAMIKKKIQN